MNYFFSMRSPIQTSSSHDGLATCDVAREDKLPRFDLSPVIEQLAHSLLFVHWTPERFELALREYRRFWLLCKSHPGDRLVPPSDVDVLWHQHLLNTQHYLEDCHLYFGRLLQHQPHAPLQDSRKLDDAWHRTIKQYKNIFGKIPEMWVLEESFCNCERSYCEGGLRIAPL